MNKTIIKIAAKMYDARDTVKKLLGDNYSKVIDPIKEQLLGNAKAAEMDVMTYAIRIMTNEIISGVAQMQILAATVDIIEPEEDME